MSKPSDELLINSLCFVLLVKKKEHKLLLKSKLCFMNCDQGTISYLMMKDLPFGLQIFHVLLLKLHELDSHGFWYF